MTTALVQLGLGLDVLICYKEVDVFVKSACEMELDKIYLSCSEDCR